MISIGNFFFRHRNRVFPLIVLALYVLAVPSDEIFESDALEGAKDIVALLIALSGLACRALVIGYAYIKRGGLNRQVYAKDLVTNGIFGVCRNPLYAGNILIYIGVFLMHGNVAVMLIGITAYLFIYQCIVLAEEAYLKEKFGDVYRKYCDLVPRWIPKLSNFSSATQGMSFNIRRVIIKDYTTLATTLIILALTEGYEQLANPSPLKNPDYLIFLISVVICAVLMTGIVRLLKKRRWRAENPAA